MAIYIRYVKSVSNILLKWLHLAYVHINKLLSANKRAPATCTVVTWVLAANGEAGTRRTTNQRRRRCAPDVISVSPPAKKTTVIL